MKTTFNTKQEAQRAFELAFGRILSIGVREAKEGDVNEYERCKWICFDAAEYLEINTEYKQLHNFKKDYTKIYHD